MSDCRRRPLAAFFLIIAIAVCGCSTADTLDSEGDTSSTDDTEQADTTAPDTASNDTSTSDTNTSDTGTSDTTSDTSTPQDTGDEEPDTRDTNPEDTGSNQQDTTPNVDPCEPTGGQYSTVNVPGEPTDRPPAQHADLNIKLRGWQATGGDLGLVNYNGPTDTEAPKLYRLFADQRVPTFVQNYQVNQWDWGCNCKGGPINDWPVTMSGMAVSPGETIHVPDSGYEIAPGLEVMVLYADQDSITLKYTAEDNVIYGYTIHLLDICVDPSLKSLYDQKHAAGRGELPAIAAGQPVGRARTGEIKVVIRDTGQFMDPRVEKDWW